MAPDRTAGGPVRRTPRSRALVDAEGSLWVGLLGGGLDRRLGRGEFTNWTRSDGLSQEVVWAIARQKSASGPGALWVGTEQGLNRLDPSLGRRSGVFSDEDGLGGNTVNDAGGGSRRQRVGRLLAGRRHPPHAGRQDCGATTAEDAPPDQFRVAAIHVRDGRRGLVRRRGGPLPAARPARRAPCSSTSRSAREKPDNVRGFAEDPAGTLYAASKQGILRLTGPSPRKFTHEDGLQRGLPVLHRVRLRRQRRRGLPRVDRRGRVIIEGDRLTVKPIDVTSGLISNKVVLLGRDAAGALWIGTGIRGRRVRPRLVARSAHYGKPDGMVSEDLDQNAFLPKPDGTVWLGSSRGLIRFQAGTTPGPGAAAAGRDHRRARRRPARSTSRARRCSARASATSACRGRG